MKQRISIITINYKVKKEIIECINSIEDNINTISYEIIVVDNEGDKNLESELKKHRQVRYIKSGKNIGFGAGNNLGAKFAKGEYLFFLNPDTVVQKNSIENLYKFIKKDKNVGIVSPLLLDKKLKPFPTQSRKELTPINAIFSFSLLRKIFPQKSIYNDSSFKDWDYKKPLEVEVIPGAALMISKEIFNKVNGFDEKFFLYFEENDLSKRVRALGYKLYINPESKIVHEVAQSTKQINNADKIFMKSRLYFLRKHYGLMSAFLTELILRINKFTLLLFFSLLLAYVLRISNITNGMPFIGDQGWFYLSARDMLLYGKIPLVGITSSHIWLHQGPLWTYMLAVVLFLFNFNPTSGAYITILFGILSVLAIYKIGSEMFSQKIGIIASLLYASSPLIVFFDRIPFDPGPIPFFTLLYFYSIFKWIKGNKSFFPLIFFFIAVLYNLELATFTIVFPFVLLIIYGLFKKSDWLLLILKKKIILSSLLLLLIPMIPVIIYDFSNGFKQTLIFLGWTIYKPFSFLINHSAVGSSDNFGKTILFLSDSLTKIIFVNSHTLSILIFILGVIICIYNIYLRKDLAKIILLLITAFSLGGILINQTPSDAYLPIIFPFVILITALFFDYLMRISKIAVLIIVLIVLLNSINIVNKNSVNYFSENLSITNKIIKLANGEKYNLIGKGTGSQYESFTMNYEYLLWWKGYPVSKDSQKVKIILFEHNGKTDVTRLER